MTQPPPPQPGPGGTWFPVIGPDGTPGWQWVPNPAPPGSAGATTPPAPAPPILPSLPQAAPPAPASAPASASAASGPAVQARPGSRLRRLYVGGAATVVLVAWGVLYLLDRAPTASEPGIGTAVSASPTADPTPVPTSPAQVAVAAKVPDAVLDDKGDGTVVVTLGVPEGGTDRAVQVARATYDVLEALADGEVEFTVAIVRGIDGDPLTEPAAREVYKATFTKDDVAGIDFADTDRSSIEGLREHSVNANLYLEEPAGQPLPEGA